MPFINADSVISSKAILLKPADVFSVKPISKPPADIIVPVMVILGTIFVISPALFLVTAAGARSVPFPSSFRMFVIVTASSASRVLLPIWSLPAAIFPFTCRSEPTRLKTAILLSSPSSILSSGLSKINCESFVTPDPLTFPMDFPAATSQSFSFRL